MKRLRLLAALHAAGLGPMRSSRLWLPLASLLAPYVQGGALWPQPQEVRPGPGVLSLDPQTFRFRNTGQQSSFLDRAFARYAGLLFNTSAYAARSASGSRGSPSGALSALSVTVRDTSLSLGLSTNESYNLTIAAGNATLQAETVFGALRGLETFSQLVDRVEDESPSPEAGGRSLRAEGRLEQPRPGRFVVNETSISDKPRFAHRGLLIDTARHFLSVTTIKKHLDAMAWVKLNVLHWHLVDDQSFPYVSQALPKLSEAGAFSPSHTYTPSDVAAVVDYAFDRGIRVVPELDTPGHTLSWGKGYPELLTPCYDASGAPTGQLGPLNPVRNATYEALAKLFAELAAAFPDAYLHLGGDEVPFDCWQGNPEVQEWMRARGVGSVAALEGVFEGRVLDLAQRVNRSYIVWQEVLDNGVRVRDDTVVQVWKWWLDSRQTQGPPARAHGGLQREEVAFSEAAAQAPARQAGAAGISGSRGGAYASAAGAERRVEWEGCSLSGYARGGGACQLLPAHTELGDDAAWAQELLTVTSQGYRALLSAPWYLNLGGFAEEAWTKYYVVEPLLGFEGTAKQAQADLVVGGEACMWGEFEDDTNVIANTWPRAAAVAERLWSPRDIRSVEAARPRFAEHRCRMVARGVQAGVATGPGFCPGTRV